jgi:phospholipase C
MDVKHIIVITPENRSFHHVFGYLDGEHDIEGTDPIIDYPFSGYDGLYHDIATAQYVTERSMSKESFINAQKKKIYDRNYYQGSDKNKITDTDLLGYVRENGFPILHQLGRDYMVCNRWFSSVPTNTFPNRNYMISATSGHRVGDIHKRNPLDVFSTNKSIFDLMNEYGHSWKVYHTGVYNNLFNISDIMAGHHFHHVERITSDIKHNKLSKLSFIDMADYVSCVGGKVDYNTHVENTIGKIYNTLLETPDVWAKTVILVVWDEYGGFYDPILPPSTVSPHKHLSTTYSPSNISSEHQKRFKFDKLGPRVPAMVISPYTLNAGINSTVYEHTSILTFIEDQFNLPNLTRRDEHSEGNLGLVVPADDAVYTPVTLYPHSKDVKPPHYRDEFMTSLTKIFTWLSKFASFFNFIKDYYVRCSIFILVLVILFILFLIIIFSIIKFFIDFISNSYDRKICINCDV